MIPEYALLEAIAECQGQKHPNADTCIKLASYYTILNNMYQDKGQSFASEPSKTTISYKSDTEFGQLIHGKPIEDVLPVIDELLDALQVLYPRLYDATMNRIG